MHSPRRIERASYGLASVARRPAAWLLVCAAEAALLVAYFGLTPATVDLPAVRYALYPFVWINVGLWAVYAVPTRSATPRLRAVAVGVAALYFLLVASVAGLVGVANHGDAALGLRVGIASPGWGPTITYAGTVFQVTFVPYLVVGYLSLSYLVYAALLRSVGGAASGIVGLGSCVGCAFQVAASGAVGAAGGSAALAAGVVSLALDLSTVAFLLAVGLLYWRPYDRSR